MDTQQITELIRHRRTVKPIDNRGSANYSDREVSRETIELLVANANWAPTHGLTEPWRFCVYPSKRSLVDLASFLEQQYRANTPEESFNEEKLAKMLAYAKEASAAIVLGMERHPGKIVAEEEVIATACAVQNLHLTATTMGLGVFWSTNPIYDISSSREYFGWMGEEDRCLGILYLGFPVNEWPERKRGAPGDVADKTEWRE
ncbi:MAG: nitroreductase [Pirellulaceae bacterium]